MQVKLFVGNLPYSVNSEELKEMFTPFGGVVSAKVVSDRETGRSRGFGFGEMESEEACERAIRELNGTDLGGRPVTVRAAEDRGDTRGPRRGPGGGGGGFDRGPRGGGGGGGRY